MEPIAMSSMMTHVEAFLEQQVYIHMEVNPSGYWRNGSTRLSRFHVKGDGPYRVFLELDGGSALIQVNDLTHMELAHGLVTMTGYDDKGRIAQTLEVSLSPLSL